MRRSVPIRADRTSGSRGARGLVLGVLLALAAAPAGAQGPAALSRYVPGEKLAAYVEFDGVDAHPAAWRASAAYRLLNETRLGSSIEDILRQLIEMSHAPVPPGDVVAALKQLARDGMAVGLFGDDPDEPHVVVVLRGGARAEVRKLIDAITGQIAAGPAGKPAEQVDKAGRTIRQLNTASWWFEKDDFVVNTAPEAVIAALDGKRPAATDHPIRAALARREAGFEPMAVGFLDFALLPAMDKEAVRLGLDGVKRAEVVLGFEGEATRTELRVVAPSPRRGLLAMLDQPTFDARSLPPIPAGVHGFFVASIDWAKTYDRIVELFLKDMPPGRGGPHADAKVEDGIRQLGGFDLRKDLLAGLGPKLTFALQDPAGGSKVSHAAAVINRLGGATIAMEVRDEAAISRAVGGLVKMLNMVLSDMGRGQPGAPGLEFRKEEGARPRYGLDLPEGLLPPPFSTMFRPTIILGPDRLIVGASADAAERAARLTAAKPDGRWQPDAAYAPVLGHLPGRMIALRIGDPREMVPAIVEAMPVLARMINARIAAQRRQFPGMPETPPLKIEPDSLPRADELVPRLFPSSTALVVDDQGARLISREPIPGPGSPAIGGMLASLLVSGTRTSTAAARRAQCTNNLKQIGLACHNVHAATKAFPAPAIMSADGKPLLSWRVAILPYVDQQELYNKFKLDEPWDSPHNKALIKEMPAVYLCPDRKDPEPGTTNYRVFVGDGTLFQEGVGTPIQAVTDGTSNTILAVESTDAVPWTKPDSDLKFDPDARPSLYGAGSPHKGGFNALFADGAVRFIKDTIHPITWKNLITRAGGEVIAADAY